MQRAVARHSRRPLRTGSLKQTLKTACGAGDAAFMIVERRFNSLVPSGIDFFAIKLKAMMYDLITERSGYLVLQFFDLVGMELNDFA